MRAMAARAAVRSVRPDLFTATGGRTMTAVTYDTYGGSAAENYERYFVPAIGAQFARDLVDRAAPRPGEHVLDLACGTGIVARLAAAEIGRTGSVAGLDVNPGRLPLAVRAQHPDGRPGRRAGPGHPRRALGRGRLPVGAVRRRRRTHRRGRREHSHRPKRLTAPAGDHGGIP